MFAAAMLYSCPTLELSIYSTCKRISQKLLRNIVKFLDLIHLELHTRPFTKLRMNQVSLARAAALFGARCSLAAALCQFPMLWHFV